jgi:hypothetical protein
LIPHLGWRAGDGEREPLPLLLVDSDIFRAAPSVLLGTIDRLALLGQNTHTVDRVAGMFGMVRHVQGGLDGPLHMINGAPAGAPPPDGYERMAPSYQDGVEVFFDPFPSRSSRTKCISLRRASARLAEYSRLRCSSGWGSRPCSATGLAKCRAPSAEASLSQSKCQADSSRIAARRIQSRD